MSFYIHFLTIRSGLAQERLVHHIIRKDGMKLEQTGGDNECNVLHLSWFITEFVIENIVLSIF